MVTEILKKLPSELQVMITRKIKDEWDIQYLLHLFQEELLVREIFVLRQGSGDQSSLVNAPHETMRNRLPYRSCRSHCEAENFDTEKGLFCMLMP